MRWCTLMTLAVLCAACLMAKADTAVFGNSPSGSGFYNIADLNGGSSTAFAVGFTPSENIDLSSVTLWLSFYTGQYGLTTYCKIFNNFTYDPMIQGGTATNGPNVSSSVATFIAPAFNDGSLAPLTFSVQSGPVTLSANTEYWLYVGITGPLGNYYAGSQWVSGGAPTGDAVYDGSDSLGLLASAFNTSSFVPAFTINAVPEPSEYALFGLGLVTLAVSLHNRKKAVRA